MVAKSHCHFQMTYEISRFFKEGESFDAQEAPEAPESQNTQLIRSTQACHNDGTIIQRPPLRRMPKFLGCKSTGDGHHMSDEKQRECCVFGN